MSIFDTEERFARLRSLLAQEPTEQVLKQLEILYGLWPNEDEEKALAKEYIDAHLSQWGLSSDVFHEDEDDFDEPHFAHMGTGVMQRPPQKRNKNRDKHYGLQRRLKK